VQTKYQKFQAQKFRIPTIEHVIKLPISFQHTARQVHNSGLPTPTLTTPTIMYDIIHKHSYTAHIIRRVDMSSSKSPTFDALSSEPTLLELPNLIVTKAALDFHLFNSSVSRDDGDRPRSDDPSTATTIASYAYRLNCYIPHRLILLYERHPTLGLITLCPVRNSLAILISSFLDRPHRHPSSWWTRHLEAIETKPCRKSHIGCGNYLRRKERLCPSKKA
jgi:hypothetical protein